MWRQRKTKILATLGPASAEPEIISRMVEAGADVFRLNMRHGSHDEHRRLFRIIRELEAASGRPLGVLADLQGPKLRVGTFAEGRIDLCAGKRLRLDLDAAPGDEGRVTLPHPEIFAVLKSGLEVLLDDGRVRLRVEKAGPDHAETVVLAGTERTDHKGDNIPGVVLPLTALTRKDH